MKKKILVGLYFFMPVLLVFTILFSNFSYFSQFQFFIPMVLGAFGYTWFNAQLILSGRVPFIEKEFGMDKILRFHGIVALVALLAGWIHKLLKESIFAEESFATRVGTISLMIFTVLSVVSLVFLADLVVNKIPFLMKFRNGGKRLKVGKYHIQVLLHNVMVVGNIFLFIHVLQTYSANNPVVKGLYILYFFVSFGIYVYHKYLKKIVGPNKFIVENIVRESETMTTLHFVPVRNKISVYRPGQFLFVSVLSGKMSRESHPFSISSYDEKSGKVSVTIKKLGDWTAEVGKISHGDKVYLDGPYGTFCLPKEAEDKNFVFLAGGVGITPFASIIESISSNANIQGKILLLWGINSETDIIWKNKWEEWKQSLTNFSFVPVVSNYEGSDNTEFEKGYLRKELFQKHMKSNGIEIENAEFYICGPPIMQVTSVSHLVEMGVEKSRIHYEKFAL